MVSDTSLFVFNENGTQHINEYNYDQGINSYRKVSSGSSKKANNSIACHRNTRISSMGLLFKSYQEETVETQDNNYIECRLPQKKINDTVKINKDDKYSFRRFAKNLLFNSESNNVSDVNKYDITIADSQYEDYHTCRNDIDKKTGRKLLNEWLSEGKKNTNEMLPPSRNSKSKGSSNTVYKMMEGELQNHNNNNSNIGDNGDQVHKLKRKSNDNAILVNNNRVLQKNENIINEVINNKGMSLLLSSDIDYFKNSRIIAITSIPKKVSLSNLLSQIQGGPLEKIEMVRKDNYEHQSFKIYKLNESVNWNENVLFLYFSKHENADNFMKFSKTGMFKVNGTHLNTIWIPDEDDKKFDKCIDKMEGNEKARRVLVFKKPVIDKKRRLEKKKVGYPDPTVNYSANFEVEDIRKDFERYGELVEILPVVSRKLCFGVQFFNVKSAIKVKHVIQGNIEEVDDKKEVKDNDKIEIFDASGNNDNDNNSNDNFSYNDINLGMDYNCQIDLDMKKKYQDWYVWYGKDPADKPVML